MARKAIILVGRARKAVAGLEYLPSRKSEYTSQDEDNDDYDDDEKMKIKKMKKLMTRNIKKEHCLSQSLIMIILRMEKKGCLIK